MTTLAGGPCYIWRHWPDSKSNKKESSCSLKGNRTTEDLELWPPVNTPLQFVDRSDIRGSSFSLQEFFWEEIYFLKDGFVNVPPAVWDHPKQRCWHTLYTWLSTYMQHTSGADCAGQSVYFQHILCKLFSRCAIYGPNALSSNMHDVSIKDLMSQDFCLCGRIIWLEATSGNRTQIVQDKSEVCVSGWVSGGGGWDCATWTEQLTQEVTQMLDIWKTQVGLKWDSQHSDEISWPRWILKKV